MTRFLHDLSIAEEKRNDNTAQAGKPGQPLPEHLKNARSKAILAPSI
jgi:hypothetical protein